MVKTKLNGMVRLVDWPCSQNILKIVLVQFSDLLKGRFLNLYNKVVSSNKLSPKKDTDSEKIFTPIEEAYNKAYWRF